MSGASLQVNDLSQTIITSLRKHSIFFQQLRELIRNGKMNKIISLKMEEMQQSIFQSIQLFADAYHDGTISYKCVFNLLGQLLEAGVCENDVTIRCICILFSSTFQKLVTEENIQNTIKTILTQLQSIVYRSEFYSMPIKKLVHDLISRAIHQFGYGMLQLYTEQNNRVLFSQRDLQILREDHQKALTHLDM